MKIRFIKDCQDKYNGTFYSANSIIEFEKERGEEILKTGYAEAIAEEAKPRKRKTNKVDK